MAWVYAENPMPHFLSAKRGAYCVGRFFSPPFSLQLSSECELQTYLYQSDKMQNTVIGFLYLVFTEATYILSIIFLGKCSLSGSNPEIILLDGALGQFKFPDMTG